jgi:heme a synthase
VRKRFPPGFLKKAALLLGLGLLQGLAGWYMVKSGLVRNPHVSHYRLAVHLVLAFSAFGTAFWFALDLLYPQRESAGKSVRNLTLVLFGVVVVQIIYGAFVAGLKAGYLYPTFPKMGDAWMPEEITAMEPVWKNFTEGHAGVQFVHRILAFLIVGLTSAVMYQSGKQSIAPGHRKGVLFLGGIVATQFILGICALLFHMPIAIAALHQTGAFLLFATLLYLLHRNRTAV